VDIVKGEQTNFVDGVRSGHQRL